MKLSIIIPTYNREKKLKITLMEIIKQEFKDYEVLVIDDASTDNTKQVCQRIAKLNPRVKHILNEWRYQRDWKKTWLKYSLGEYVTFFDDDIEIRDKTYLWRIVKKLTNEDVVYQSKIIMEDACQVNHKKADKIWEIVGHRSPIVELFSWKRNYWIYDFPIFPMIEFGNYFHKKHKECFIEEKLILDGYWESIVSSFKLIKKWVKILLSHDTVIYHVWSQEWGSKRFNKKSMLRWFTKFHEWYIHNMIYIHATYKKYRFWLWIPFFIVKWISWIIRSWDFIQGKKHYFNPMIMALRKHLI